MRLGVHRLARQHGGPMLAPRLEWSYGYSSQTRTAVSIPPSRYLVNDFSSKNIVEKYLFTP